MGVMASSGLAWDVCKTDGIFRLYSLVSCEKQVFLLKDHLKFMFFFISNPRPIQSKIFKLCVLSYIVLLFKSIFLHFKGQK